jgi:Outer membrane protein beta-barrel domain
MSIVRRGRHAALRTRAGLMTALLAAMLAAAATAWAPPAQGREGIHASIGYGRQNFSSGLTGVAPITNASNEIHVGEPASGGGIALGGGYGFNEYVSLDMQVTVSGHNTVFDPGGANEPYKATLNAVVFGVKVSTPVGDVGEVFGRAGFGGYELSYSGNNLAGSLPVDDSRFSGRGFAFGVGAELFFQRWGVQLAYTLHKAHFDTITSKTFMGGEGGDLPATISSISLLFNYYLQ